jgi:hypothetical protein
VQPDGISPAFGDDANGLRLGQCWAMDGSNGFVEVGPCMVLGAHELCCAAAPCCLSLLSCVAVPRARLEVLIHGGFADPVGPARETTSGGD